MKFKELVKKSLYYSGYYALARRINVPSSPRLLILMYHDLVADDTPPGWQRRGRYTAGQFATQMRELKRQFRVLSVQSAIAEIKEKGALTAATAAVTFDDGFLSTYTLAYPILSELSIPATVYLPTDWINRKMTPWWLKLHQIIDQAELPSVPPDSIEKLLEHKFKWKLNGAKESTDKKSILQEQLEPFFRDLPDKLLNEQLDRLRDLLCNHPLPASGLAEPMSWEMIREMADNGIEFGAHTCSHLNLRHATLAEAETEMAGSKAEIERQLGRSLSGFAYPYGADSDSYQELVAILEQIGFEYAVTTVYGNNDHQTNRYLMRRSTLPLTAEPSLIRRNLIIDYLR